MKRKDVKPGENIAETDATAEIDVVRVYVRKTGAWVVRPEGSREAL
jgi:hypothetical protein